MTHFYLYCIEMYLVGHRRNSHSNQDTQTNIKSYHAALKRWMKVDNHQLRDRILDFLVWHFTTLVVIHYMYNHGKKFNDFILNKRMENIVANDIIKAKTIPLEHIRRHETPMRGWQVQSQDIPGRWYDVIDPYTSYASCSCEWCIRGNMCKHQLAIIKASTDIPWGVMLEFLGTYYGSLRGGIEAMFELSIPINPFEDGGVHECGDNIDNTDILEDNEEDMEDATNIGGDIDNVSTQPLRQTQPSIEGCLLAIQKLQDDTREEAMGGGLLLVQQLQAMMTKTLTDVKRIRGQLEANNLHPQRVFEVVDDGLGNSIVRKKDFREQAMLTMSSQKKRNRSALDG